MDTNDLMEFGISMVTFCDIPKGISKVL